MINNILHKFDSTASKLQFSPTGNYDQLKLNMLNLKNRLKIAYLQKKDTLSKLQFLDSVGQVFSTNLLNQIVPHWYGTEWDFEGYTSTPNKGTIACGYFVSTTLKDMGLNINRYKLAQQNPKDEATTIAKKSEKYQYKNISNFINLETLLSNIPEGLYFVGLDYHVGYFYKLETYSFFIHSNYITDRVMIENAIESKAFKSESYHFAEISKNQSLMYAWIFNIVVPLKQVD
ncbi:MAG: hypothetical protein IPO21_07530 [Bacteroidales bacterium]|nr:hypothetical protein [Bacteroidales bacterium]